MLVLGEMMKKGPDGTEYVFRVHAAGGNVSVPGLAGWLRGYDGAPLSTLRDWARYARQYGLTQALDLLVTTQQPTDTTCQRRLNFRSRSLILQSRCGPKTGRLRPFQVQPIQETQTRAS